MKVLKDKNPERGGISIDLISSEHLDELGKEKVNFILGEVKQGKVLVLEKGLTSSEEMDLIKVTMREIDHDSFIGIETPGFSGNVTRRTFFQRLLGRAPPPRMMVVGPAHLLKTIKKDGRTIEALILTREQMLEGPEEGPEEDLLEEEGEEAGEKDVDLQGMEDEEGMEERETEQDQIPSEDGLSDIGPEGTPSDDDMEE